ncbi:MAG: hypothetical protein ACFB0G_05565 [Leptolyngbyaceae cyanobacterium]
MGKQTPHLVIAVLIVCSLVILALQNASPSLAIVFLGVESIALPLGVWLSGAISLGALTAIAIMTVPTWGSPSVSRGNRRRWTVRPEPTPSNRDRNPEPTDRMPRERPPRRWAAPAPFASPPRASQSSASGRTSRPAATVGTTAAAEDWQTWEQRSPPSQWEDWSQANGGDPAEEPLSKHQRQDRQKATTTIQDLETGWDDSAQDTVYVAPGGSQVEDTLDDIADGWEDWDAEDNPLADTAYAQRYEGEARQSRRDAIYAPPDDAYGERDWQNQPANPSAPTANSEDETNVYDADYRVIIPPYQPLDESESEGDRPT